MWSACTKLDVPHFKIDTFRSSENFFSSSGQSDPKAKAIIAFLQRQNDTLHFVDKTISRVGYPVWEKMIFKPGHTSITHRGGGGDAEPDIYYIPFVRENESVVNAVIVVTTLQNDTSYTWRCDWEYQSMTKGSTASTDSAGQYATFFMSVNHHVFNYKNFGIIDSSLFFYNGKRAYSAKIKDSTTSSNVMQIITNCSEIEIGVFTTCPYGPGTGYCEDVCDHCPECLTYFTTMECWQTPGDPGSTGGGGGQSGSTDGSPPVCSGGSNKSVDPCGAGWEPIDDEEINTHGPGPCDAFIDSLTHDANFVSKFYSLRPNQGENFERGFIVQSRQQNIYTPKTGYATIDGGEINWGVLSNVEGTLHNHYIGIQEMFSPKDLLSLAQSIKEGEAKNNKNFFIGVYTNSGPYLLKISNPNKFADVILKIAMTDRLKEKFNNRYYKKFRYLNDSFNNELEFLAMLYDLEYNTGLNLYRGNAQCTLWTHLEYVVSANLPPVVQPNPCN